MVTSSRTIRNKCGELPSTEIKCSSAENRYQKYFREVCDLGLQNIPDLKRLFKELLNEVEYLKCSTSSLITVLEEVIKII